MFSTDGLLPRNTRIESLRLQNPFLAKELIDFKNQVNHNKFNINVIYIFSLYQVIVRHTKIMNRADKNWAHF